MAFLLCVVVVVVIKTDPGPYLIFFILFSCLHAFTVQRLKTENRRLNTSEFFSSQYILALNQGVIELCELKCRYFIYKRNNWC